MLWAEVPILKTVARPDFRFMRLDEGNRGGPASVQPGCGLSKPAQTYI